MTVFFPSHSITIRRLRNVGNGKSSYSATFTGYSADIQPIGADRVNSVGGRIGSSYEAWVDASVDIKEGDQLDSGGTRYSVRAVEYYHGAGLLDHKHLILSSESSA
jgi:hypothetical protein